MRLFTHWFLARRRQHRVLLGLLLLLLLGTNVPNAAAQTSAPPGSAPWQDAEPPLLPGPSQQINNGPWFQIICPTGQRLHDDPIVFPGQPGDAHEHQFFGARGTDAFATYARLAGGDTTCSDRGDSAAYWLPALYDADGVLRTPRRVRAYYYANSRDRSALRAFPPNLRIIAGDARATSPQPRGVINWLCRRHSNQSQGLPLASAAPPRCNRDAYLSLSISFPDCWDGVHLDSSDHRRHMAYADSDQRCPATHPVKLPRLRLSITYEEKAFTGGDFTLGGPRDHYHALPWSAMHADFWNTWQQGALEQYVDGCLRRGRAVRANACT